MNTHGITLICVISLLISNVFAFGILGTDIIATDLSFTNVKSSLECAQQCDQTQGCMAWVWDSCGGSACWMKKSYNSSNLVPSTCRTSLQKIGDIGVDRSGSDMPGMPLMLGTVTASACANQCSVTAGCVAWSFDSCGKSACWLKSTVTSSFPSSCRTSAVQETPTFPLPQPCTGICSGIQDTFLIKRQSDGTYFRFSSFDGIQTATSKTLTGPWQNAGPAFPDQTSNDPIEHWTPDVHYIGGLYYMYYTLYNTSAVGGDRDRIQVATSPNLESGTWTQHGEIGLPKTFPTYSRIDANLLLDPPRNPFIAFGSYAWGLFGISMASNSAPLQVKTGMPQLLIASKPIPSDPGPTGLNRTEGTFLYLNGGYYYYFYAVGNCCPAPNTAAVDVYHVEVCRGVSAAGPYYSKDGVRCDTIQGGDGTLFLGSRQDRSVYSPGGVGILDDGNNGSIFYYQYLNTSIGYPYPQLQWGYNHVVFQNGWPLLL